MAETKRKGWFARLFDMNDDTVSASTVFLVFTSIIGLLLLFVPSIGMMVDIYFNHTITIDLGGLAEYILAASGVFASGGILKGWTNYSNYRFRKAKKQAKSENETEDK